MTRIYYVVYRCQLCDERFNHSTVAMGAGDRLSVNVNDSDELDDHLTELAGFPIRHHCDVGRIDGATVGPVGRGAFIGLWPADAACKHQVCIGNAECRNPEGSQ